MKPFNLYHFHEKLSAELTYDLYFDNFIDKFRMSSGNLVLFM